jgi:predicted CopG family antitoxin
MYFMDTKYKTIRLSVETYDKLTREGTVRDSFDDVIGHLLRVKNRNTKEEDMER